jgi:hypothetical protein
VHLPDESQELSYFKNPVTAKPPKPVKPAPQTVHKEQNPYEFFSQSEPSQKKSADVIPNSMFD